MSPKELQTVSPYPWFYRQRNILLLIAGIFLFLASTCFALCYQHYQKTTQNALVEDRTSASLMTLILEEHFRKIEKTLESYAHRPLLIEAVRGKSIERAQRHLENLTRHNPDIQSVVITDPSGTLWFAWPPRPDVIGKNFAYREWYSGVSRNWRPYISDAILRTTPGHETAIHVAMPVIDHKDSEVIGVLLNTYPTTRLAHIISRAKLAEGVTISVVDRKGRIIFSSRYAYQSRLAVYPFADRLRDNPDPSVALTEPLPGKTKRYLSPAGVSGIGWTVVVERDRRSILKQTTGYFIITAVSFILLFAIVSMLFFYYRKRLLDQAVIDRLETEKELRASDTRFHELFDHMSSGVAIYEAVRGGEDFIFSDMNQAAIRITGFREDYRGRSVRDVFPGVVDFGLFRVFQQVWRTGIAEVHPTSMYTDRHLAFWAENYVYKLPSGQIVAVFDDVTESKRAEEALKESEKKLREAQEMAHLGFWAWDVKTGRVEWSNEVFKIFGLSPKDFKPQIDSIMALSPWPEDHERDRELIRRAMENHAPGSYEQKFLRPDQSVGYYYSTFQGQYDEQGSLVSIVGTVLDITERKRTEESINKLNEELEQKVALRTAELAAKNAELERLNRVFVDRELRMKELKARIAELEKK